MRDQFPKVGFIKVSTPVLLASLPFTLSHAPRDQWPQPGVGFLKHSLLGRGDAMHWELGQGAGAGVGEQPQIIETDGSIHLYVLHVPAPVRHLCRLHSELAAGESRFLRAISLFRSGYVRTSSVHQMEERVYREWQVLDLLVH